MIIPNSSLVVASVTICYIVDTFHDNATMQSVMTKYYTIIGHILHNCICDICPVSHIIHLVLMTSSGIKMFPVVKRKQ